MAKPTIKFQFANRIFTRETARWYSHAVLVHDGKEWQVLHWCGSLALGEKQYEQAKRQPWRIVTLFDIENDETLKQIGRTPEEAEVVRYQGRVERYRTSLKNAVKYYRRDHAYIAQCKEYLAEAEKGLEEAYEALRSVPVVRVVELPEGEV